MQISYFQEDILMPQFKERMFFHHFLECVFMFNDVRHASWIPREGEFALDAEVDKQCSLEGRTKFEQRMKLYKYMVRNWDGKNLKKSIKFTVEHIRGPSKSVHSGENWA
jgi:hypothetical protein